MPTAFAIFRIDTSKIEIALPQVFFFFRFPAINPTPSPVPFSLLPVSDTAVRFFFPDRPLAYFPEMIGRAATIAPLCGKLVPQHITETTDIKLSRHAPQSLRELFVSVADLGSPIVLPFWGTRAKLAELAELEFAGVFERILAFLQRSEMGRLGEGGRGHGFENFEMGLESRIIGQEPQGVQAALGAYWDVVGQSLAGSFRYAESTYAHVQSDVRQCRTRGRSL